jgi:hypothetical protein
MSCSLYSCSIAPWVSRLPKEWVGSGLSGAWLHDALGSDGGFFWGVVVQRRVTEALALFCEEVSRA